MSFANTADIGFGDFLAGVLLTSTFLLLDKLQATRDEIFRSEPSMLCLNQRRGELSQRSPAFVHLYLNFPFIRVISVGSSERSREVATKRTSFGHAQTLIV